MRAHVRHDLQLRHQWLENIFVGVGVQSLHSNSSLRLIVFNTLIKTVYCSVELFHRIINLEQQLGELFRRLRLRFVCQETIFHWETHLSCHMGEDRSEDWEVITHINSFYQEEPVLEELIVDQWLQGHPPWTVSTPTLSTSPWSPGTSWGRTWRSWTWSEHQWEEMRRQSRGHEDVWQNHLKWDEVLPEIIVFSVDLTLLMILQVNKSRHWASHILPHTRVNPGVTLIHRSIKTTI